MDYKVLEKIVFPKAAVIFTIAMFMLLSPTIGLGATIDVYPGEKIQGAVNSASAGDTIIVHTGTYTENIEVKKQLTIRNSGNVTVNARTRWDPCIRITSSGSGSTIRGLTLGGATFDDGIHLDNADGCYIENNHIRNNGRDGIHIKGDNNTLSDNTIDDNQENGIHIHGKQNKIFGSSQYSQSISNCGLAGIRLDTGISPFQLKHYNEVYNNLLEKNFHGIRVVLSSYNEIHDNKILDHHQGISLRDSASNDIYGNMVKWNKEFGINIGNVLWLPSKSNLVHNNTVSECTINGISLTNIELSKQETLNQIYENDISACLTAINSFWENADVIRDNTMTLVGVGIALEGSKETTIFQNRIRVDVIGLWFINSSSDKVSFNSISSLGHALINTGILSSPGHVNAKYNWWGSNDDPGSQIEGSNVDYTPYLVLSVDANPEKIFDSEPLNSSTITADLWHDSSGNYHDPTYGHVPDGIPVAFDIENIPNLGSLNPLESSTSSGSAASTFNATDPGNADITATVDWETVHASVTIDALSSLSITKKASSDPVTAGRDVTYAIEVHNSGPGQAENVKVTDVLPAHLGNVRYSLVSEVGPWQDWPPVPGYVDFGDLPVDQAKSVWIIGTVDTDTPNGTVLKNTASVTSTTYPGPISTFVTTTVAAVARVALEKTVDDAEPYAGDRVTFTVTVTNNGPSEAQDVLIGDDMPQEFTDIVITPSKGSYDDGLWTIPALSVGEKATLTLKGTVTRQMECNTYTNTASTNHPNALQKIASAGITVRCPAPTVTTQAVSGIGTNTATGNGNITDLGSPNPTQHGVCWNTTGNPTTADSKTDEGPVSATGAFASQMAGLSPDTNYFVRAYATNTAGTSYGNEVPFTTRAQGATVTTQAVTDIGKTTATGNGTITDLGVPDPAEHGFCWNTTGNPTTADSKTDEGPVSATGAFSSHMSGLSLGTIYYVRAYATNTAGTSYGNEVPFTTRAQGATVTTQAVTDIGKTTATGNGNVTDLGSPAPTEHGVCWNTTGTPTIAGDRTEEGPVGATGAFTSNITALSSGTTYYVRAYVTDAVGTIYGNQVSFTTDERLPTVTTQAVTAIGTTTADGNGTVTSLGSPPPTEHGVCWNTTGNPTIADSKTDEGPVSTTGAFASHMSGLSSDTVYYVRAYATNTAGTSYGNEVSFGTRTRAAKVTTLKVTGIGATTATGNGYITDLGSPAPTQHGVCWNTTGTPTIAGNRTEEGPVSATGAFTSNITALSSGTTYYVRAYITDAVGTIYGNQVFFNTVAQAPTITDFNPGRGGPGTVVTIHGTNFTGTTVEFGGTSASSFTVDTTTQITAVVGDGSTGKVTVTTDHGTATSAEDFIFDVPIPTLNEWGMIMFGLLLMGFVVIVLKKRRGGVCL